MTLKANLHKSWLDFKSSVLPPKVINQTCVSLNERLTGGGTNWFFKEPDDESNKLLEDLRTQSRDKKIVCVFPSSLDEVKAAMGRNLAFDKPISCSNNIFTDQLNWLEETVEYFSRSG